MVSANACSCSDAQSLGLKVLWTWAFSDGLGQWNAIQPELGQINEPVLSQVLHILISMSIIYLTLGLGTLEPIKCRTWAGVCWAVKVLRT